MPVRTLLTLAAALAGLTLLLPAGASAQGCSAEVVQQTLVSAGKLTQEQIDSGVVVSLVRCGDVTGDGVSDAVYTLTSGGTAGDTRFGVLGATPTARSASGSCSSRATRSGSPATTARRST